MTRKISDFSSEVLAEYIRQHCFLPQLDDLLHIEARLEYRELQEKVDAIIDKKRPPFPTDPGKVAKRLKAFLTDDEKLDALWKRQDELSKIMFPHIYTAQKEDAEQS